MIENVFEFLFKRVRPEFYYSVFVVVGFGVFSLMYFAFEVIFYLVDMSYSVNWEILCFLAGCIGLGELGRAFSRLYLTKSATISIFFAGGVCISSFTFITGLKWGHPLWVTPASFIGGGIFYFVLVYARKIDQWCWSRF